jgi:hypothetical protein
MHDGLFPVTPIIGGVGALYPPSLAVNDGLWLPFPRPATNA